MSRYGKLSVCLSSCHTTINERFYVSVCPVHQ